MLLLMLVLLLVLLLKMVLADSLGAGFGDVGVAGAGCDEVK